jgi:two-component sensor histidine kinase
LINIEKPEKLDIYVRRRRGKIMLLIVAVMIGFGSLWYTNWLTDKMAQQERKTVELWAEATKRLVANTENSQDEYLSILTLINTQDNTIPIINVDENDNITIDRNIKYKSENRMEVLKRELARMKSHADPIKYEITSGKWNYLYYRESNLLRNLRFYPIIQLFVIILFIIVAYFAFHATQRAEQNQVWVGMSKETAHQLGTPISSLMAWIELLKMQNVDENLINEFQKDTQRLEKITERFSKIGSRPELTRQNLNEILLSTISYLKTRSSSKVKFEAQFKEQPSIDVPLNSALFSWVIENLCKNAMDAMDNDGQITISVNEKPDSVILDITDTGKGVPKSQHKTIFNPGFSTKKRGWGLGLSLAKRIVENYHRGKIFIKWSEMNKGTTFRIILNK